MNYAWWALVNNGETIATFQDWIMADSYAREMKLVNYGIRRCNVKVQEVG